MRRHIQQHFTLDQRLANQQKLVVFQIAQPAVDEFCRPGGRARSQVIHFRQANGIATAGSIARDTASVNPAANDEDIKHRGQNFLPKWASLSIK